MTDKRKPLHLMLPPEIHAALKANATKERRSMMAEATIGIEQYLAKIAAEREAEVSI